MTDDDWKEPPPRGGHWLADSLVAVLLVAALGAVFAFEQRLSNSQPVALSDSGLLDRNSATTPKAPILDANPVAQPDQRGLPTDVTSEERGSSELSRPETEPRSREHLKATPEPSPPLPRLALAIDDRLHDRQRQGKPFYDPMKSDKEPTVTFFQTESKATSVAFVVDCSGSMGGSRLERAKQELANSVLDLKLGQKFFVTFFHNGPVPMFSALRFGAGVPGEVVPTDLVGATPLMKVHVHQWIMQVPPMGGTFPESSLLLVAKFKPDVIYLLSDGQFNPLQASTYAELAQHKIPVNTLAFEDPVGGGTLEGIAMRTGGTYRFVPPGASPPGIDHAIASRLAEALINTLSEPSDPVRQESRQGLRAFSNGRDFGPQPNASADDLAKAVSQWTKWWVEERLLPYDMTLSPAALALEFKTSAPLKRWAAVIAARHRKLDLPGELIAALRDTDEDVRQEARQALVQLAGGDNYGPSTNATDQELATAVAAWMKWWDRKKLVDSFATRSQAELVQEFKNADPQLRQAAITVARLRNLNIPGDFIAALSDTESFVHQEARKALVRLARGKDCGPPETASIAEQTAASEHWTLWWEHEKLLPSFAKLSSATLLRELASTNVTRRWAAVESLPANKSVDVREPIIGMLADTSLDVRQAAHAALVQIAKGQDFGPSDQTTDGDWNKASKKWFDWYIATLEKQASGKFVLAKTLLNEGRHDAAKKWLQEIVQAFPKTPTAKKAAALLKQIESTASGQD